MTLRRLLTLHPELIDIFLNGEIPPKRQMDYKEVSYVSGRSFECEECMCMILPRFFENYPDCDLKTLDDAGFCVTMAMTDNDLELLGLFACHAFYSAKYVPEDKGSFDTQNGLHYGFLRLLKEKEPLPFSKASLTFFADEVLDWDGDELRDALSGI